MRRSSFYDPDAADLHAPAQLPPARVSTTARSRQHSSPKAARSISCTITRLGRRRADGGARGLARSRARCWSAPTPTRPTTRRRPRATRRASASAATCVIDRAIVDKNARIGDGVPAGQRSRRPGSRRRRLVHPQRHHHRAEERSGEAGDCRLTVGAWCSVLSARCGAWCRVPRAERPHLAPGTWHMAPHEAPGTKHKAPVI